MTSAWAGWRCAVVAAVLAPGWLSGQARSDSGWTASGPTLTPRNRAIAVGLAFGGLGLLPADRAITRALRRPTVQGSAGLREAARELNAFGHPGTLVIGAGMYAFGRAAGSTSLADVGLHTTEAVVVGAVATSIIKGLTGRQRPFVNETDPNAFGLWKGFSSDRRASFPSGHATAAFAFATAAFEESRHWWPRASRVLGPVLFASASGVAVARVYSDKHWASDVVFGAGVGTVSGLAIVRINHAHRGNRLDRLLGLGSRAPLIVPLPNGVAVTWR